MNAGDCRLEAGDSRTEAVEWRLEMETGIWGIRDEGENGGWKLKTGDWRLDAGSWRPGAGARRLESADWKGLEGMQIGGSDGKQLSWV